MNSFTKKLPFFIFPALLILVVGGSLITGQYRISLFNHDSTSLLILWELRLPRILIALCMGACLGVSGTILQGIFKNPLADPYILGTSSGAALAATFSFLTGQSLALWVTPAFAMIGAIATTALVLVLGRDAFGLRTERLLLAGVGIGFFFSALLLLVMSLAKSDGLKRALLWMSGDLGSADSSMLLFAVILMVIGVAIGLARQRGLNALALGDEMAHGLGLNPGRERIWLVIAASLLTAASVALGGIVGFVGLMVPHVVRSMCGADVKKVIPLAALGGAILVCLADTIGRSILPPLEIPAGIVTALIGAPWFLVILRSYGRGGGLQ